MVNGQVHRSASGDECCLEEGRLFAKKLNPSRWFSTMPAWQMRFDGELAILKPKYPFTLDFVITITVVFIFFCVFYGAASKYLSISNTSGCVIVIFGIATELALCFSPYLEYSSQRQYGNWMEIDQKLNSVYFPRFEIQAPIDQMQLIIIIDVNREQNSSHIGDEHPSFEKWSLDALIRYDDNRHLHLSLVGEIGGHSIQKACNRLKEQFGVNILKRISV